MHLLPMVVLVGGAILYCLAWALDKRSTGPGEPEHIRPQIPWIGHLINLMRKSFFYFSTISQTRPHDIVTINIPGQKFYIVKSPDVIQAISKRPNAVSHDPLIAKVTHKVCGTSQRGSALMQRYVVGDLKSEHVPESLYAGMRDALKPGPNLDRLNVDMGRAILQRLSQSADSVGSEGRRLGLSAWTTSIVVWATTCAIYGNRNPYSEPALVEAFWNFEKGLSGILFSPVPSITARKATAGREKVARAIETYYRDGRLEEDGSEFAKVRYRVLRGAGFSNLDVARYEVAGSFATFVNTSPVAFWMIRDIYSHADLLSEIRTELDAITAVQEHENMTINMVDLVERCPLLLSTYREVTRRRSVGGLAKLVQEDTVIDTGKEQFLLKKNAILQIPSDVFHHDERYWGTDAADFRPRRSMQGEQQETPTGKRPTDASFRVFGGGKTLCPGRFFARTELLAVVAVLILRYNIVPADGASWSEPTCAKTNITTLMKCPDYDIPIFASIRPGMERYSWAIKSSGE